MAIFNGTAYILAIGGTTLPDQTEGSISLSMETRDTSTKGSAGFRSIAEGMRSGSISVSGLVADDSDAVSTLMTSFSGRSTVAVVFGVDGTSTGEDDHNFSASGYVTSIEASASVEDNVTYSATIELTGTITFDGTDEA
jgi:TP901-1 family phage major tail protein